MTKSNKAKIQYEPFLHGPDAETIKEAENFVTFTRGEGHLGVLIQKLIGLVRSYVLRSMRLEQENKQLAAEIMKIRDNLIYQKNPNWGSMYSDAIRDQKFEMEMMKAEMIRYKQEIDDYYDKK